MRHRFPFSTAHLGDVPFFNVVKTQEVQEAVDNVKGKFTKRRLRVIFQGSLGTDETFAEDMRVCVFIRTVDRKGDTVGKCRVSEKLFVKFPDFFRGDKMDTDLVSNNVMQMQECIYNCFNTRRIDGHVVLLIGNVYCRHYPICLSFGRWKTLRSSSPQRLRSFISLMRSKRFKTLRFATLLAALP